MDCNCGNKNEGNFPPSVFQVNSTECPVLFHKVVIPTNFGDETETPVLMGEYKNALVYYEVNGHTYLYSSDGVPTRLDRGGASVLYVEELPETSKAMQDTLYVSSRGELAVYKSGDKKILNEKPTYYTTLGNNTDGAMTQKAVTDALSALSEEVKNKLAEFKNGVVDKVMPEVNEKVSGMERFVTTKIEEMKRETSTLVNTTTNDVNLMKNSLNKHIEQADITKNDLLDKIRRNTDSINDTKNSLRNYALISDVDNRVTDTEARTNNKITQAETRVNNTIGQAKTELDGKITEANGKISALDTRLTKQASDNKADITQLKANLNTTNSALLTHKEQADKKFDDIKVEQSDQDTLISDILNAFSKESEKGTNLKLNTSATKVLGMTIYGNTEQVKTSGYNIFRFGDMNNTLSQGIKSKMDENGYITSTGTATTDWASVTSFDSNSVLMPGTYTLSIEPSAPIRTSINGELVSDNSYKWLGAVDPGQTKVTFTVTEPIKQARLSIRTVSNQALNIKFRPMLEFGSEAHPYEPYTGNSNNLFYEFSNLPLSRDGVTLSNQNGILKLTGQPTADWVPLTSRNITSSLQDKQTYTVFQSNIYGVKLYPEVIAQRKDGGKSMSWNGQNAKTFTFTVDFDTYSSYSMKLQMGPKTLYPEPITFYNNYALFVGNYTADNLPEYSPFNTPLASPRPQLPQVVKELSGGSIAVKNKNLLKISNIPTISNGLSSTVADDGTVTYSGQIVNSWGDISKYTIFNSPLPAGTYTLSIDHPRTHRIIFKYRLADYNFYEQIANMTATSTSETFTVNQPIISGYLYIAAVNGSNLNDTVKAQLESGNTATAYEPYQEQTLTIPSSFRLYKLTDDIYDEVKLENGVAKLIKRVGKLVLNGDEYFDSLEATNSGQFYTFSSVIDKQIKRSSFASAICSHMNMKNGIWRGLIASTSVVSVKLLENDTQALRFMFSAPDAQSLKITNVASFKNWLKAEKAKGTPVTVYYEMKTSTEEEITDPALLTELKKLMEMRTYKDVTNISITGTDLTPEIKVKYMRKIGE